MTEQLETAKKEAALLRQEITLYEDHMAGLEEEIKRQRARIESLRGLCKTAVGMLRDADRDADAETIAALIGDMEP